MRFCIRVGIFCFFLLSSSSNSLRISPPPTAFVIFVQSDLKSYSGGDKENFTKIWDEILKMLVTKIFQLRNVNKVYFYPLNKSTNSAQPIIEANIFELFRGTPYRIRKNIEGLLKKGKFAHAKVLEGDNSDFQDILSSYTVLNSLKDNLDDVKMVKAIFISDMVHYQSGFYDTDAQEGIFNFANEYSLGQFLNQLEKGIINGFYELKPIFDISQQKLQVYSIFLSRDNTRDEVSNTVLNQLNEVWEAFFYKIGAERVRLHLRTNSLDQIFQDL